VFLNAEKFVDPRSKTKKNFSPLRFHIAPLGPTRRDHFLPEGARANAGAGAILRAISARKRP
jgi:hypothetical protein